MILNSQREKGDKFSLNVNSARARWMAKDPKQVFH
jgi:hypothetical protein